MDEGRVALLVSGPGGDAIYPGAAFRDPRAGEPPYLMIGESGEFLVTSASEGPGEWLSMLTLTLVPDGAGLVVEAVVWSRIRAGAEDGLRQCSVDLRTGEGMLIGPGGATDFAVRPGLPPLAAWDSRAADAPEPYHFDALPR